MTKINNNRQVSRYGWGTLPETRATRPVMKSYEKGPVQEIQHPKN